MRPVKLQPVANPLARLRRGGRGHLLPLWSGVQEMLLASVSPTQMVTLMVACRHTLGCTHVPVLCAAGDADNCRRACRP
jgi:hypothetical protein